jgi:addiction module HigA family antidote
MRRQGLSIAGHGEGSVKNGCDCTPTPTGSILLAEFLEPMGLSQNALARAIKVPPRRINEIVLGKRAVTADTDLRLAFLPPLGRLLDGSSNRPRAVAAPPRDRARAGDDPPERGCIDRSRPIAVVARSAVAVDERL